jgi:hypothetical protein
MNETAALLTLEVIVVSGAFAPLVAIIIGKSQELAPERRSGRPSKSARDRISDRNERRAARLRLKSRPDDETLLQGHKRLHKLHKKHLRDDEDRRRR